MPKTLTDEQYLELAKMLIAMGVPKEMRLEVLTVIDTPEELLLFLDKLSAKNYEMTPEEVYEALGEVIEELQRV